MRGRMGMAWLVLAWALGLAGCVTIGYVKDPSPWVNAADWDRAERVRVALAEYSYSPQVLQFEEGKPYVLEIVNIGREKHYFTAPEFFRAVAARKAQVRDVVEVKANQFTAIEVYPGQTVELYFVAVRPDTYEVVCTIPGHTQKGMTGALQIQPRPKETAPKKK